MASGPYLSAAGVRVTTLDAAFPYYGAPVADIALADGSTLPPRFPLVIGNLTQTVAVLRQRAFAGVTHARLVGGFGGWQTIVGLAPYNNPGGVLLSSVLNDVAKATGAAAAIRERVRLAAGLDRSLGVLYVPETGAPASRLLSVLAGREWWIDTQGVTQIANARPTSTISSKADVDRYDGGRGLLTVATEDPAAWMPGASYTSPTVPAGVTVRASRIRADNGGTLRVEALVA